MRKLITIQAWRLTRTKLRALADRYDTSAACILDMLVETRDDVALSLMEPYTIDEAEEWDTVPDNSSHLNSSHL